MKIILVFVVILLLILLISIKLSLTAYIAWMEENHFKQPSDRDMQRLIVWCAKKYLHGIKLSPNESGQMNRKTCRNMIICFVCMCISIICLIIHLA